MVALIKGTKAPPIELLALDGKRYNLQLATSSTGLVVLAFFKVSCPTCQFAFPFLERLHQRYPTANIWGVSQDDFNATEAFATRYGLTFPVLLDDGLSATVKYDLSTVPSIFFVDKHLAILQTSTGFVRSELELLNRELAKAAHEEVADLFHAAENVPDSKPG
jgi:peroxiredoxin